MYDSLAGSTTKHRTSHSQQAYESALRQDMHIADEIWQLWLLHTSVCHNVVLGDDPASYKLQVECG